MSNEVNDRQQPFLMIEKVLIEDEDIKPNDLMVYVTLKRYANWNTGKSFPSIKTLCKNARLSDKPVKKSLDRLVELGYIKIDKIMTEDGRFPKNTYTLLDLRNHRIEDDGPSDKSDSHRRIKADVPSENIRTNYISNNYIKNNNIEQQADDVVKKQKPKKNTYSEEFEQLWSIYPKKRNKSKAYQRYKEALVKHHPHEVILYGVESYANECRQKNTGMEYIKMLEGFLNDERYLEYRRMDVKKEKKVEELSLY